MWLWASCSPSLGLSLPACQMGSMRSRGSACVQSPAPDSWNAQGKVGSVAGARHVGAGTRQDGWRGGLKAGAQAQADPDQETELWGHGGVCDGRSVMWASCIRCTLHPQGLSRSQAPSAGSHMPVMCVGHGVSIGISVPVVVSVTGWLEVYMGWTRGCCTAGLR